VQGSQTNTVCSDFIKTENIPGSAGGREVLLGVYLTFWRSHTADIFQTSLYNHKS